MLTAFRNNHAFTGYLMNHQQLKPRGTYRFQLFDVGLSQKTRGTPQKSNACSSHSRIQIAM